MARPRKCRCVEFMPDITYFKPRGVPTRYLEEIRLSIEELESVRLKDLEGLDQEECSLRMHISRATFQRILDSARKKMAEALVSGKALRMEGGDFEMALRRFRCSDNGHEWQVPFGTGAISSDKECPTCSSPNVYRIDQGRPWTQPSREPVG